MAYNPFQTYNGFQQQYPGYMQPLGYAPQPTQNSPGMASNPVGVMSPAIQQTGLACRPVTSRAEVDAFQIPFDGSTTYFVDTSTGKIYAKTFDRNTGTAPIVTYVPEETIPAPRYATLEDLNQLREEFMKKQGRAVKKNESDE